MFQRNVEIVTWYMHNTQRKNCHRIVPWLYVYTIWLAYEIDSQYCLRSMYQGVFVWLFSSKWTEKTYPEFIISKCLYSLHPETEYLVERKKVVLLIKQSWRLLHFYDFRCSPRKLFIRKIDNGEIESHAASLFTRKFSSRCDVIEWMQSTQLHTWAEIALLYA